MATAQEAAAMRRRLRSQGPGGRGKRRRRGLRQGATEAAGADEIPVLEPLGGVEQFPVREPVWPDLDRRFAAREGPRRRGPAPRSRAARRSPRSRTEGWTATAAAAADEAAR